MTAVAIIGAGPAGLAMAIQLKRYGLNPAVYECRQPGGLLWNANLVENYPGFPGGIRGPELVRLMIEQARETGVEITYEEVTSLDYKGNVFSLRSGQKRYQYGWVAIASGTNPIYTPLKDVPDEARQFILYEVYPLLNVKWKKIVMVGAGDAAFDYALNLAWQNEVTILNRGSERACLPLLFERVQDHPNISYLQNIGVSKVELDTALNQLQLTCTSPAGLRKLVADFLIFAIGREPRLDFLSENLIQSQADLVETGRLFLIGDVKNAIYRQTAIAVGDGIMAAMKLYRESKNHSV